MSFWEKLGKNKHGCLISAPLSGKLQHFKDKTVPPTDRKVVNNNKNWSGLSKTFFFWSQGIPFSSQMTHNCELNIPPQL